MRTNYSILVYKVIILSDNCQSSFPVDSFIVLRYPIHPTTHSRGVIATENNKRWLSYKIMALYNNLKQSTYIIATSEWAMQYVQYVSVWLSSYLQVKFNCLPVFIFTYHFELSSYLPKTLDRLMRDFKHPPLCKLELPIFIRTRDLNCLHIHVTSWIVFLLPYTYHIAVCSDLHIKLEYLNVYISRWTLLTSTYRVGLSSYL